MRIIVVSGLVALTAVSLPSSALALSQEAFDCIAFNYWLYASGGFEEGEIRHEVQRTCDAQVPTVVPSEDVELFMDVMKSGSRDYFIDMYGADRFERAHKIAAAAREISKDVTRQLDDAVRGN